MTRCELFSLQKGNHQLLILNTESLTNYTTLLTFSIALCTWFASSVQYNYKIAFYILIFVLNVTGENKTNAECI